MRTVICAPHTIYCTSCTYQGCLEPAGGAEYEFQHCACYHDDRRHLCCYCEAGLQISPTSMR